MNGGEERGFGGPSGPWGRRDRDADASSAGERYLAQVAARLRMPLSAEREVVDELRAHLDDAREALEAEGLDPEMAEREAMARLGSPDALGDDLRRTHQTRRRLLAAVGGGVWDGLKDAFTGYIVGIIVVLIVFAALGTLAQQLLGSAFLAGVSGRSGEAIYSGSLLSIAAWWGARGVVRSLARRALRRTAAVRAPVAVAGAVPMVAILLFVVRLHYTWAGIAAMLAIPLSWVVAAITTPEPGRRSRWAFGRPSPRLLGLAVLAVFGVSMILVAIYPTGQSGSSGPQPNDEALAALPDQEHWALLGYLGVAPSVVGLQQSCWYATPFADANGDISIRLDEDTIDWDEYGDLRAEAWRALPSDRWVRTLDPASTGPYATVPVAAWEPTAAIIPVGRTPGVDAYLLFVTGVDRTTGERVAIGYPDGEEVGFIGTIVDWFTRLDG